MLSILLAQMAGGRAWGLGEILIACVVIAAIVGVALIAIRGFGLNVPPWVFHIAWIVALAFVAILAIRFLLTL